MLPITPTTASISLIGLFGTVFLLTVCTGNHPPTGMVAYILIGFALYFGLTLHSTIATFAVAAAGAYYTPSLLAVIAACAHTVLTLRSSAELPHQ